MAAIATVLFMHACCIIERNTRLAYGLAILFGEEF